MAGWENSNEEIYVESVEELVDTNPDLYKQRTIAALSERRYRDAMCEAEKALDYGNNKLEYQVLKARVYFESDRYSDCMQYTQAKLFDKLDSSELLQEEKNYIFYIWAVCYRELGRPLSAIEEIIVTADGRGMYSSVQEAVNRCSGRQTIILLDGYYEEVNGVKKFCSGGIRYPDTEISIRSKNVKMNAIGNVTLPTCMIISNSNASISGITFMDMHDDKYTIFIGGSSNVTFNNIAMTSKHDKEAAGIKVTDNAQLSVQNCTFHKMDSGIDAFGGETVIENSKFHIIETNGVSCTSETTQQTKVRIYGCDFNIGLPKGAIIRTGKGTGVLVKRGGYVEIHNCSIREGLVGVGVEDFGSTGNDCSPKGECLIQNSKIHRNSGNIAIAQDGCIKVTSSVISGATKLGLYAVGNPRVDLVDCQFINNMKLMHTEGNAIVKRQNVRELENDLIGSAIDSLGSIFKSLFS